MSLLHELIASGRKQELLEALKQMPPEELAPLLNDTAGERQQTPLHLAVLAGWHEAIAPLVRAGADTAKKNFYEETPLYAAIDAGARDCAEALLQSGASANARRYDDGITLLQLAIEKKSLPMVELLLYYGADAAAKTPPAEKGLNAFHYAAHATTEIMAALLHSPGAAAVHEIAYADKKNISALRIALERSDRAMAEQLLDYGVNVNETDDNGETPLYHLLAHRASREETLPLIRLLLRRGADVDKLKNFWDETPLFPAVRESFAEAVGLLLSLGLDAKQTSHLQETPLHLAAEKWDAGIVRALIRGGADIEARNRNKRTPLHVAAHANRPKVAEALLEAGADPFARDKDGKTPRDLAPAQYQLTVNRLLDRREQEIEIKKDGYSAYWNKKARGKEPEKKPATHFSGQKHSPHRFRSGR